MGFLIPSRHVECGYVDLVCVGIIDCCGIGLVALLAAGGHRRGLPRTAAGGVDV